MNNLQRILTLIITVMLALTIVGCTASVQYTPISRLVAVEKLPVWTIVQGIQAALNDNPGTYILTKNNLVLIIWREGENYHMYVANVLREISMAEFMKSEANTMNGITASSFESIEVLKQEFVKAGWKIGNRTNIPIWLVGLANATTAWATTVSSGLPTFTFMVIPCENMAGNLCGQSNNSEIDS